MVFGWGKKKTEPIPEPVPQNKEISLSEVQKIIQDLLELRKTQTIAEIRSLRNQTSPLILELAKIIRTLEQDTLKVEDIDKHLRVIVVRGKKQVIDVIKRDATDIPEISNFDDVLNLSNDLNQKLKKIGDVLGRQTRVIHIFAKKYAQKMKDILEQMNSNNNEIKKLVNNFQNTSSASDEITEIQGKIKNLENNSMLKNKKILEIKNEQNTLKEKIKNLEEQITKIKQSENFSEFLKLNQEMNSLNNTKNQIKNEIDTQFTKISRALGRYEYIASLDKEQKSLLTQLINNPIDAINLKNKDSIVLIFENVKKGINSGSISVKDTEKSLSFIKETENSLEGFIKKIENFNLQKNEIQKQLTAFDKTELNFLEKDLEKTQSNVKDYEQKISTFKIEIEENKTNIPELIFKIEKKLKEFSKTDYHIQQNQN